MSIPCFENSEMLSALKSANSILLCTHVSPDGDAIGSLLCTGMMLKEIGKQVTMACTDAVPARLSFLKNADAVVKPDALADKQFDLSFALDAGDLGRVGACADAFLQAPLTIQMDHHGTNPGYAMYNEIDPSAAATGCLVLRLMHALNVSLTKDMAECLYAAVSSDTGNFSFSNANEEAFTLMSELMRAGLELAPLARRLHLLREKEHVALLGRALNSLHFYANDRATGMRLSKQDFEMCGASAEHCDKIVNYGIDIEGVKIAYLADERESGKTKFSLRAQPPCNVSEIAAKLGGGGHKMAAGCALALPLDEACALMEREIAQQIKEAMHE